MHWLRSAWALRFRWSSSNHSAFMACLCISFMDSFTPRERSTTATATDLELGVESDRESLNLSITFSSLFSLAEVFLCIMQLKSLDGADGRGTAWVAASVCRVLGFHNGSNIEFGGILTTVIGISSRGSSSPLQAVMVPFLIDHIILGNYSACMDDFA